MAEAPSAIARHYQLDPARPATTLAGLPAWPAIDRRDPARALLAIRAAPGLPPRPMLAAALETTIPHAMMPVDCGPGRDPAGQEAWFMLCPAPPGPKLDGKAWEEAELVRAILLPAATALDAFALRGWTHRAIRPDNLFRAGRGQPAMLGPCWALPPAYAQPALFEPPYAATCHPAARGDGTIADDVYALGVTLLVLALGGLPLPGLDDAAILRRKREQGSFGALAAEARLPPLLTDLLRGMLAEDPDHRPSAAQLLQPREARLRRVALRPPARALRQIEIAGRSAWTAPELAQCMVAAPDSATALLRGPAIAGWLRRSLTEPALAARIEELARAAEPGDPAASPLLLSRSVAALDPLAPMCWRGELFWPDGIGPALAAAAAGLAAKGLELAIGEAVEQGAVPAWAAARARRDAPSFGEDAEAWRSWLASPRSAGRRRLVYGLNPLLPCASPLLAGRQSATLAELLPALEAAAATADRSLLPLDGEIAAFIVARADTALQTELARLLNLPPREAALRLYARLQHRLQAGRLTGLALWLLESGAAELERWANRRTRVRLRERLGALAAAGEITAMAALLDDEEARRADRQGQAQATARIRALEASLHGLETEDPTSLAAAERLGHEVAVISGLIASLGAALAVALG